MFERIDPRRPVLVTGPHRSGTTIAASIIAAELDRRLVVEERCWEPYGEDELIRFWLNRPYHVVIQAPFIADNCHAYPEATVVFMMRSVQDIVASHDRMFLPDGKETVNWRAMELLQKKQYHNDGPLVETQYAQWEEQKERLPRYLELDYESLRFHPLWKNAKEREGFWVRQVQ